jgi:uncharacterized protein with HEPN domain
MKPDEKQRVEHIIEAITKIEKYIFDVNSPDDFLKNNLVADACLFQYSIIGEAIINISRATLSKYDYPWHLVRSFRNYIAHEYFGIKLDRVYQYSIEDLPELKSVILAVYENEF